MIGEIFENISSFRHESVVHVMKIREQYGGETSSKPFLSTLQKDIVAYISGYVCRKTKDRLQHYSSNRFLRIVNALNQKLPGVKTQAHAMSYPNLMTLSLTRGRLTQVDYARYNFFCYLEVSIHAFLQHPIVGSWPWTLWQQQNWPLEYQEKTWQLPFMLPMQKEDHSGKIHSYYL